jgi:hypothetical protein
MITNAFKNADVNMSKCLAYVLGKIDYSKLGKRIAMSKFDLRIQKIVLFEYVHSGVDVLISQEERLPGTTIPIHSIVTDQQFTDIMNSLFGVPNRNTRCYFRRKIDYHTVPPSLTHTRQFVLEIVQPSLLFPESDSEYDDMPPLVEIHEPYKNW